MKIEKRIGRPSAAERRDLRAEILVTSRELLDAQGPDALSMREVARRTGCTHQAPYHHFADRETILAALVGEGFETLASRLKAANDLAETHDRRVTLLAAGEAYVGFAMSHPGVFRIMFRPDTCNPTRFPEVLAAGLKARGELQRLAEIVSGKPSDTRAIETTLWAHVHGLASLLIDGPLAAGFSSDTERNAHLADVARCFVDQVLPGKQ